jgi:hypothetical protein
MTVTEARAIAREYDTARVEMQAAIDRFNRAERAFRALPLAFDLDETKTRED